MKRIFLYFSLLIGGSAAVLYKDCGSSTGKIKSVDVKGCNADVCELKRGQNATVMIDFINKNVVTEFNAVVHAILKSVPIPFHMPNADGCVNSGVTCPLKAGASYGYISTFPIMKIYPAISLVVKYELKDTRANEMVCALIPVKIV